MSCPSSFEATALPKTYLDVWNPKIWALLTSWSLYSNFDHIWPKDVFALYLMWSSDPCRHLESTWVHQYLQSLPFYTTFWNFKWFGIFLCPVGHFPSYGFTIVFTMHCWGSVSLRSWKFHQSHCKWPFPASKNLNALCFCRHWVPMRLMAHPHA